jgi:hypothetical protein
VSSLLLLLPLLLLGISRISTTVAQTAAPVAAQSSAPVAGQPVAAQSPAPVAGQPIAAQSPAPAQSSPAVQVGSPEPSQTPSVEPTKAPVTSPPTQTTPDCFTSTTDLFDILELASPFVDKEYILCPNTVFNIGVHDDNGVCCQQGQMTLYAKSKTHIKCGESGSSSNNCTIRGGEFQLLTGSQIFEESILTEVKFSGLTWEACTNIGMVLATQGDITFVDNIIKVCFYSRFQYPSNEKRPNENKLLKPNVPCFSLFCFVFDRAKRIVERL